MGDTKFLEIDDSISAYVRFTVYMSTVPATLD